MHDTAASYVQPPRDGPWLGPILDTFPLLSHSFK